MERKSAWACVDTVRNGKHLFQKMEEKYGVIMAHDMETLGNHIIARPASSLFLSILELKGAGPRGKERNERFFCWWDMEDIWRTITYTQEKSAGTPNAHASSFLSLFIRTDARFRFLLA